jgi:GntR family transcriptional regulator
MRPQAKASQPGASDAQEAQVLPMSAVPLYLQIREIIRHRILEGSYPAHGLLPSESQMTAAFGVSRITIRQALNDLQKEGMIFKVAGKGTFVSKPKAFQNLSNLRGFGEEMNSLGYETFAQVLSKREVRADEHVARQLGQEPGSMVYQIQRLRYLNREPISVDVSYFPLALGERLSNEDLQARDVFAILERDYGLNLTHADVQIDAITVDEWLAAHLRVSEGAPLLRIERLTYSNDRPIDFEYLYYRGDAFHYRLRIDRK